MPAQVHRHEPEFARKRALNLFRPAKMVLRPAVDEQDRWRIHRPEVAHVELQPAAAFDAMRPHRLSPTLALTLICGSRHWPCRAWRKGHAAVQIGTAGPYPSTPHC